MVTHPTDEAIKKEAGRNGPTTTFLNGNWTILGCIPCAALFWPTAALLGISPVSTVLWKYLYKFMQCNFNENYRIVETPKYPHTKEWLNQLLYSHWVEYYATVKKKKKKAALFTSGKTWNQSKCPLTHKWKYKMWCILFRIYRILLFRILFSL